MVCTLDHRVRIKLFLKGSPGEKKFLCHCIEYKKNNNGWMNIKAVTWWYMITSFVKDKKKIYSKYCKVSLGKFLLLWWT